MVQYGFMLLHIMLDNCWCGENGVCYFLGTNSGVLSTGTEFVRPVVGYFCNLCNVIYATEEEAKDKHCKSPSHREKVKVNVLVFVSFIVFLRFFLAKIFNLFILVHYIFSCSILGTQGKKWLCEKKKVMCTL